MINKRIFTVALLATIFLVTSSMSYYQFRRTKSIRTFPDTVAYTSIASYPIFSSIFWTGIKNPNTNSRPLVYPLFIKLCGSNSMRIVHGQLLLSITCWAFLASCVVYVLKRPWARIVSFALIEVFTLTTSVSMWHKVILSESLTCSLLVVCVGSWLLFTHRQSLFTTCAVICSTGAYSFSRDSNGYLVLMLGVLLLVLSISKVAMRQKSRFPALRLQLFVASTLIVIFIATDISSNIGQRWMFPFFNNMAQRILPKEVHMQWFKARGMPYNTALMERAGKWASSDNLAFYVDERLENFREWTLTKGKADYVQWILLHPTYLLVDPVRDLKNMLCADLSFYAPSDFKSLIRWPYPLGESTNLLYAFALGMLLSFCLGNWSRHNNLIVVVPTVLIAFVIPHLIVIWHGDAMELIRHSVQVVVQINIALLLLIALFTDIVLEKYDPIPD